jgi:hypothetical protein
MEKKPNRIRPKNFVLILFEVGSNHHKTIKRWEMKSIRRFTKKLKLLKSPIDCYLRVSYGRRLDYRGEMSHFINEGSYDDLGELFLAFRAFCEP